MGHGRDRVEHGRERKIWTWDRDMGDRDADGEIARGRHGRER